MAHFGARKEKKPLTPVEWYGVNSQVGELVFHWSGRDDLLVSIGESAGGDTAFFDPYGLEVQINSGVAWGPVRPSLIGDMRERKVQLDFPKASGAIFHETMHARYTTWDLKAAALEFKDEPDALEALHLLEESRIERRGVEYMPKNKPLLRSCALEIVLADMTEAAATVTSPAAAGGAPAPSTFELGIRRAIALCALALARVDAGVLEPSDVEDVRKLIDTVLDADLQRKLRLIWKKFQSLVHVERQGVVQGMYKLSREWAALTQEAAADEDKATQEMMDAMEAFMEGIGAAMGAGSTEAGVGAQGDISDQQTIERREAAAKERAARAKERGKAAEAAGRVFKKGSASGTTKSGSGTSGWSPEGGQSASQIVESRAPSAEERAAAAALGRALEKAKYHDRTEVVRGVVTPPGRLRVGAAMQGTALRSMGRSVEAMSVTPFQRTLRRNAIDPNLTVGIMTDVSGSQGRAVKAVGPTVWMIAEAVNRIQGKAAVVYYGQSVFPGLRPGEKPKVVETYSAPDGVEEFNEGFMALDGALHLLDGTGARLLVITSDGWYKNGQREHCERWLKRCVQQGVGVLWLGFGESEVAEELCSRIGGDAISFVQPADSPIETTKLIGRAAVVALGAAGASR